MINCKFRDWNRIYTNFATLLPRLFFAVGGEPSEHYFIDKPLVKRPAVMQVMLRPMGPAKACASRFTLTTPSPSNMPAWLDPWQLRH